MKTFLVQLEKNLPQDEVIGVKARIKNIIIGEAISYIPESGVATVEITNKDFLPELDKTVKIISYGNKNT